jgi:mannosyltransferase OCH1-like enzyme
MTEVETKVIPQSFLSISVQPFHSSSESLPGAELVPHHPSAELVPGASPAATKMSGRTLRACMLIGSILLAVIQISTQTAPTDPWDLPVVLDNLPDDQLGQKVPGKFIPRNLWIAVRNQSEELNFQMPGLFARNKGWKVHICGNEMKDEFMNKYFKGTSLLWAYNMISPAAGAAKADLWRYAVLWTYGGAYIDDDSDLHSPLDEVIKEEDKLIVSYEKNGFNGNRCYIPRYHLSDFAAYRDAIKRKENVFHGRILLNWAMISAPRHPIIFQTMKNAVEIIKHEYTSDTVMRSLNAAFRWEVVMCATGPSLLTASAREIVLARAPDAEFRLAHTDFKEYGGRFKAVSKQVKHDPTHYMNTMNSGTTVFPLLLCHTAILPYCLLILFSYCPYCITVF